MSDFAEALSRAISPTSALSLAHQLVLERLLVRVFQRDISGLRELRDECLAVQEGLYDKVDTEHRHLTAQYGLAALESLFAGAEERLLQRRGS